MKSYKIVASDLDGTLLNNKSEVSRENLFAVNALLKRGVYFVPSTGRTFSEMPEELKNNPDIQYVIYSNGAVVYDKQTGNRISNCIPNCIVREILDVLNSCESHITFRQNGESFVDAMLRSEEAFDYYNVCEPHRAAVRGYAVYLEDFKQISYAADDVEVFSVFFHNDEERNVCRKYLDKIDELRVVESFAYNLEIVSRKAGKGNALRSLADLLDIDYADTISVGDSDNDSSIITAAGLGLAVSNSAETLKAIADEVICSNEEHAIAYILSHYFS